MTSLRIVFMGSPGFAVPSLRAVAALHSVTVVGVVCQPDKPAGRGKPLTSCAVKVAASALGLPLSQPEKLRDALPQLQTWAPHLILVAAYGKILRANVLNLPRLGCLNVHASLLPYHRGAAPIQAALLAGDTQTGVTLMKMDEGLDTGPMLASRSISIAPGETAVTLTARLADLGAEVLQEALPDYIAGKLTPIAQDESKATYAPLLKKEDGRLRFNEPAAALERRVRALYDWPGAYVVRGGSPLKILRAHVCPDCPADPGRVIQVEGQPAIGTAAGALVLDEIQPAGRKPMPGRSYLNGNPNFIGVQLD